MSNYYQQPSYGPGPGQGAQNLQFYPSSYSPAQVSGHATPQQASYGYGAQPSGSQFGAGGAGGFGGRSADGLARGLLDGGDPPLLEELGVNFGHIQAKTLAVLNPFRRIDQHLMDDSDLAGPILFFLTLTFARSSSVLGYCLLPMVATSLVGIAMPMDTPLGIVLTTMAILWSTYSASGMFCAVGRMRGMRGLVAYPLALFYVGFGIMGIFSSRGSGALIKAAAGVKA
uniref:Golgi membrane protein n=1 Tax=Colletotrichum fructicola (strain Nara gc5) TaxID=1213859 RepID=L2G7G8_COLFN